MLIEQILYWALIGAIVLATFGIPIALTVWSTKNPYLLSPLQKFIASLLLIASSIVAVFLLFPAAIDSFAPTNRLLGAALTGVVVFPQGILGAAIAGALLVLKLNPASSKNTNWWWWCVTLCTCIWSTYWVLALGTSFNGW